MKTLKFYVFILITLFVVSCTSQNNDNNSSFKKNKELLFSENREGSIHVIELTGSNYEMGLQHGKLLKNEIHDLVKLWEDDIELNYHMTSNEFISNFLEHTDYLVAIKRWTPHLYDEIKGISDGAEIDLNTMIVFQLIDEIWTNGRVTQTAHHCTSIGILNRNKGDSVNYIAQNIDVTPFYHKYKVLLSIKNDFDSVNTYVTTFPGYIGANGLNQNIGVTVNSLMDLESSIDGLPVCCIVRGILDKQSFFEAEQFLKEIKHASGQNYIIGSKNKISSFECSASKVSVFWPDSSLLYTFHANNSLSNDSYNASYIAYLSDSLNISHEEFIRNNPRLEAIKSRIIGNNSVDLNTIKEALASKDNSVEYVCNKYTWVSTIMEFHEDYNLMLISPGTPDSNEFIEFKIR